MSCLPRTSRLQYMSGLPRSSMLQRTARLHRTAFRFIQFYLKDFFARRACIFRILSQRFKSIALSAERAFHIDRGDIQISALPTTMLHSKNVVEHGIPASAARACENFGHLPSSSCAAISSLRFFASTGKKFSLNCIAETTATNLSASFSSFSESLSCICSASESRKS